MPEPVDFFQAVVTAYPEDADHAPLLHDPIHARVARAGDVAEGDLILAGLGMGGADYFNDQYTARPEPYYAPACGCGVCCHLADHPGAVVVLSNGRPWQACDPWPTDGLVLIIPAHRLPERTAKE
ncbi:hypothetical protein [Streptomyces sp. MA15]|uniref:hypothetical protein n=1 Tax=Streptomyces sp. MA15 TaxID=3055061 RepID=UPI0025B1E9E4|nr:hypothetical protein [Streptomyces sp. MA15]MDN3271550.1 hypothetical protein [Streptomyces sp. MA15]